ncbi:MAG: hypothetical protein IJK41_09325 [Muribaculaceae bacterium]|nr:hypothetical protein [Muribaculaceae bacterium]
MVTITHGTDSPRDRVVNVLRAAGSHHRPHCPVGGGSAAVTPVRRSR